MSMSPASQDSSVKLPAETMSLLSSQPLTRLSSDCVSSEAFGNNKTSMAGQDSCKEKSFVTASTSASDILTRLAQARADLNKRYQKPPSQALVKPAPRAAKNPVRKWREVTAGAASIGFNRSKPASQQQSRSAPVRRVPQPTPPSKHVPAEYVFFTETGGGPPHKTRPQSHSTHAPIPHHPRPSDCRDEYQTSITQDPAVLPVAPVPVDQVSERFPSTTGSQYDASSKRAKLSGSVSVEHSQYHPIEKNGGVDSLSEVYFRGAASARTISSTRTEAVLPRPMRTHTPAKQRNNAQFRFLRSLSCPPRLCEAAQQNFRCAYPVAGDSRPSSTASTRDHGTHFTVRQHPTSRLCNYGHQPGIAYRPDENSVFKSFATSRSARSSPNVSTQRTNLPARAATLRNALSTQRSHSNSPQRKPIDNSDTMSHPYGNGFGYGSSNGSNGSNSGSNNNFNDGYNYGFSNSYTNFTGSLGNGFTNNPNALPNGLDNGFSINPNLLNNGPPNGFKIGGPNFMLNGLASGSNNFKHGFGSRLSINSNTIPNAIPDGFANGFSARPNAIPNGFANGFSNGSHNLNNGFYNSYTSIDTIDPNKFDDFLARIAPEALPEPVADTSSLPQQNSAMLPFKSPQQALQHAYQPQHSRPQPVHSIVAPQPIHAPYQGTNTATPAYVHPARITRAHPVPAVSVAVDDDDVQVTKHVIFTEPMTRTPSSQSSVPSLTGSSQTIESSASSSTPSATPSPPTPAASIPPRAAAPTPKRAAATAPKYTIRHEMRMGPGTQGFRCTDGDIVATFEAWVHVEKKLGKLERSSQITFDCTVRGYAGIGQVLPFWLLEAYVNAATADGSGLGRAEQLEQAALAKKVEDKRAQQKVYRERTKARSTEKDRVAKTEKAKKAREEEKAEKMRLAKEAEDAARQIQLDKEIEEFECESEGDEEEGQTWQSGELQIVEPEEYLRQEPEKSKATSGEEQQVNDDEDEIDGSIFLEAWDQQPTAEEDEQQQQPSNSYSDDGSEISEAE